MISYMVRGIRVIFEDGIGPEYQRDLLRAMEDGDRRLLFLTHEFLTSEWWKSVCSDRGIRALGDWVVFATDYKKNYDRQKKNGRALLVQGEGWN